MREDDEDFDPIAQAPSPEVGPARRLELDEAIGVLETAIADLPPRQQQAFLLRNFEGLDVERNGERHGLFGRQCEDALFPRAGIAARATRRSGLKAGYGTD